MNDAHATSRSRWSSPWRIAGWSLVVLLLSLPAILRFPWTGSDFVIMALLLGSVGLAIEFLLHQSGDMFVRLGSVIAVLTSFLTIWVNLAVGMIGDDNAYNLLFLIPLAAALIGGVAVRLAPGGMVKVMLTAAALQAAIGLGGYGVDPRGALFSACFGLFWLLAAALFRAGTPR